MSQPLEFGAEARCVTHRDQPAVFACDRCGNFACAYCKRVATSGGIFCRGCRIASRSKIVRWVPGYGIVMAVHGAMTVLVALYTMGLFTTFFTSGVASFESASGEDIAWMSGAGLGVGFVTLATGVCQLVGGVRMAMFRSRSLALLASMSSLVTVLCYCFPTGAVMIPVGLVILLNDDVAEAFAINRDGSAIQRVRDEYLGQGHERTTRNIVAATLAAGFLTAFTVVGATVGWLSWLIW